MRPEVRRSIECVVIVALAGAFSEVDRASAGPEKLWDTSYKKYMGAPAVSVGAVVRDFDSSGATAHPDFGKAADAGAGRYANIFGDALDANGDPVFSSTGQKVLADGTDAEGNIIPPPRTYIGARPGDTAAVLDNTAGGAVTSAATVAQWFSDVPGVNSTTRTDITFVRDAANNYVFDGSLDNALGASDTDYTAEVEYHFVHEEGSDWFFDVATDGEVWVYIDGQLVIDGGRGGAVDFDIKNGAVVPSESYSAVATVLGTAFSVKYGATTYNLPLTAAVRVGATVFDPFKISSKAITGNLNDGKNPRSAVVATDVAGGTGISVIGYSWMPLDVSKINWTSDAAWKKHMTTDTASAPITAKVLRNGDAVPNIKPFQDQATIISFLQPYLDPDTQKVTLGQNQAIYLLELYTTDMAAAEADFQDIAILVDLAASSEDAAAIAKGVEIDTAVPPLSQRIDFDRLGWLEDGGSHKIKILFANRTGAPSNLRLTTNMTTLNLASRPLYVEKD